MKILLAISNSFCANFIKGQGEYLTSLGYEVIIVSGPGEEIDRLEQTEPVRVIRIDFTKTISPLRDFKALVKVIKIIYKEKPDIINAGNPKTGFLFSLAHILFWNIPLVFTLRGIRSDTLRGIKRKIVKFTEFLTCKFANKVISISPSLKIHAINIGIVAEDKCIVLSKGSSNGLNLDYYSLNERVISDSDELTTRYQIAESTFMVAFVGRITKDKGLIELIDAVNSCVKNGMNIKLIIAGPVEREDPIPEKYYSQLKNSPNIIYIGKQKDVRPVYALADALILYSHREGFGNVVIEAASFALPVIVADIPGLRDTTVHLKTGLIIESENSKELEKAILKLYNDRELAVTLGENGRERVEKYFANEIVWSEQVKLYEELCR